MKLATYSTVGRAPWPGALLSNGHVADLSVLGPAAGLEFDTVADLLSLGEAAWEPLTKRLAQVTDDPSEGIERGWVLSTDAVELLPPTGTKPFFLSCGGIYVSHRKEMGVAGDPPRRPEGYIVNPNILVASGRPVVLPEEAPGQVDWEGEFCLVFGRAASRLDPETVLDHVAGYTIYNDISARDNVPNLFSADSRTAVGGYAANILYKQFPTFGPLGPCIVTRDELPDVAQARLRTSVNGQVMQDEAVGNLTMTIAEVVAAVTEVYSFGVGDILSLGTPAGVGYARSPKVFLHPGDVVEVSVDGIGTLSNPVVAAEDVA